MWQTLREIWSAHPNTVTLVLEGNYSDGKTATHQLILGPDHVGKCITIDQMGNYELRNADVRYWKVI